MYTKRFVRSHADIDLPLAIQLGTDITMLLHRRCGVPIVTEYGMMWYGLGDRGERVFPTSSMGVLLSWTMNPVVVKVIHTKVTGGSSQPKFELRISRQLADTIRGLVARTNEEVGHEAFKYIEDELGRPSTP